MKEKLSFINLKLKAIYRKKKKSVNLKLKAIYRKKKKKKKALKFGVCDLISSLFIFAT